MTENERNVNKLIIRQQKKIEEVKYAELYEKPGLNQFIP